MSKIGKKPVKIPEGVQVTLEGSRVKTQGTKGELSFALPPGIKVEISDGNIAVLRSLETKYVKSLHGTVQRVLENATHGVSEGWSKQLELVGTGYRARLEGQDLVLAIGFSHPVRFSPPEGIVFTMAENNVIVSGVDKHTVGQVAANIRAVRPPEPYKGKGIKYTGEYIRRKAGKAAKAAA